MCDVYNIPGRDGSLAYQLAANRVAAVPPCACTTLSFMVGSIWWCTTVYEDRVDIDVTIHKHNAIQCKKSGCYFSDLVYSHDKFQD
jgi:hypothetical protein